MEVRRDCNVPDCDMKHLFIFRKNKALISEAKFFHMSFHWETYIEKTCKNCTNPSFCLKHKRLVFLKNIKKLLENSVESNKMIEIEKYFMNNWFLSTRTIFSLEKNGKKRPLAEN